VDRALLADALQRQYKNLPPNKAVQQNISLLSQENTYTVCTAHQPNLATGYLYFVYKIIHAVKLAETLKQQYPDKNFVPVYYMGSEDNDLQELGTFRYEQHKFVWDGDGQTGAVGRMKTAGLATLLHDFFRLLGPPGVYTETLKQLLTDAYLQPGATVASAMAGLVHALFGQYGLVMLNPDDAALKKAFCDVLQDDLLEHTAHRIVSHTAAALGAHYKVQAFPRPVNLFYLRDNLRTRIEQQGAHWVAVHTKISWSREALLQELEAHPERFSPNVILRGVFQERILPNVAFIGGGAEVAYWLQLKEVFDQYNVFFPAILLRQSVLWITRQQTALYRKMGFPVQAVFKPEQQLQQEYIAAHSPTDCIQKQNKKR
jgi:bacillithiol biosynthesis cysteine-adding enzyme BshC